jgi:hypothetical protein
MGTPFLRTTPFFREGGASNPSRARREITAPAVVRSFKSDFFSCLQHVVIDI